MFLSIPVTKVSLELYFAISKSFRNPQLARKRLQLTLSTFITNMLISSSIGQLLEKLAVKYVCIKRVYKSCAQS